MNDYMLSNKLLFEPSSAFLPIMKRSVVKTLCTGFQDMVKTEYNGNITKKCSWPHKTKTDGSRILTCWSRSPGPAHKNESLLLKSNENKQRRMNYSREKRKVRNFITFLDPTTHCSQLLFGLPCWAFSQL